MFRILIVFGVLVAALTIAEAQSKSTTTIRDPGELTEEELKIADGLSWYEKLKKHVVIATKAHAIRIYADKKRDEILTTTNSAVDYAALTEDYDDATVILLPYLLADAQATYLRNQGFTLNVAKEGACKQNAECVKIDPMTGAMMLAHVAAENKNTEKTSQAQTDDDYRTKTCGRTRVSINGSGDICPWLDVLFDKPLDTLSFGIVPGLRDLIIDPKNNGEIAKLIRDPLKRPVQIVENIKEKVKNDKGEVAKIMRQPLKCTFGRISFRKIKKC